MAPLIFGTIDLGLGLACGAFLKCLVNREFAAEVKALALARKGVEAPVQAENHLKTENPPAQKSSSPKTFSAPENTVDNPSTLAYQQGALHLLAELQKEGRLVDFLEENLSDYQDEEIGSSVRSIHEGCKKVLTRVLVKEKIVDQEEESSMRVNRDYEAHSMKLSGRVSDQFPLKGVLVHPGWRAKTVNLQPRPEKLRSIIAPAEVEIG